MAASGRGNCSGLSRFTPVLMKIWCSPGAFGYTPAPSDALIAPPSSVSTTRSVPVRRNDA